jgi:hypothetical protein
MPDLHTLAALALLILATIGGGLGRRIDGGLLPELAKFVFGDRAETPAAAVAEVVRAVTGTDDPARARAAIEADPALATQLRVELARIAAEAEQSQRAAELDTLRAHLADVQSARRRSTSPAPAAACNGCRCE